MKFKYIPLCVLLITVTLFGCTKSNYDPEDTEVLREWIIPIAAANENPAPAGRNETGELRMQLHSDNSLRYDFLLDSLQSGDELTMAHIHTGNAISNGPIVLDLKPRIINRYGSGVIENVRNTLVDSLRRRDVDVYFNLHSRRVPSGIARAQLNNEVVFARDAQLTGSAVVPSVTTTATGTANIRVTADKKIYSRVTVNNLEPTDALVAANISRGAIGATGNSIITLATTPAQFGTIQINTLSDAQFNAFFNDPLYINVVSTNRASGVLRAQLR